MCIVDQHVEVLEEVLAEYAANVAVDGAEILEADTRAPPDWATAWEPTSMRSSRANEADAWNPCPCDHDRARVLR